MNAPTDFRVVIPARYASERLPGKVLAELGGRPIISHVHERAMEAGATETWITSDDDRVLDVASRLEGARVFRSCSEHRSGSDRIAELARAEQWADTDVIVNLQGDEPFMPGALVAQTGQALIADPSADIATACCRITGLAEFRNPNAVKVVRNAAGHALYFSRSPIPYSRSNPVALPDAGAWRHLGIYAYRAGALKAFSGAAPDPLEVTESLEQLRALAMGMRILVVEAAELPGPGIDTQADLARARQLMEADT